MPRWDWSAKELSDDYLAWHQEARRQCQREIVQMTHLAASGHPGGSLSSLDFYLLIYSHANLDPRNPRAPDRDRVVVSHGHTSPGVYSVLARLGFFPGDRVLTHFRRTTSVFEGHIEREVPGVEWTTGNLGQGLSAATGMALGMRLNGVDGQLYVPMGDGEQAKGQISEARRFILKYRLHNITVIVDRNWLQIGGDTREIMPNNIENDWRADGWQVRVVDGHDLHALHAALRRAHHDTSAPHAIIADTVMGKGISFMENKAHFHGVAASADEYAAAARESGEDPELWDLGEQRERIARGDTYAPDEIPTLYPELDPGTPRTYQVGDKQDNRGAFGNAILDVARANAASGAPPMAAFDCDLEGSVKLGGFHKAFAERFFQSGIQEHHTAACAGALSTEGIATVWADFGVFGICETYNQHRLSDINSANLKLVCTHIGLDVGEDGKTHQCIDYVGVLRNIFGMNIIVPADPNETDRAFRYMIARPGMFFLGMGRSKLSIIAAEDGTPYFGGDHAFVPGRGQWIRRGTRGAVVAMGTLTGSALRAVDGLRRDGLDVGMASLSTPVVADAAFLDELARAPFLVTVEDHNVNTGLGECLASALFRRGHVVPHLRLGVDAYAPSGSAESVFRCKGLDTDSIAASIEDLAKQHA